MKIVCEEIPNTEQVTKALFRNNPASLRVRRVGASNIPGLDVNTLKPCVLPFPYPKYAQQIESLRIRADDVFVASFPKSGTTWTQEMVWLIANNMDFVKAKQVPMRQRYTFIELSALSGSITNNNSVERVKSVTSPRFIKTHLPVGLLPTQFWTVQPKLVYVARNLKDAAISYYHHYCNLKGYKGTLNEFLDSFLNDLVDYSPAPEHVLDYWHVQNQPNILFITYEEMSSNLRGVARKVSNFFGKVYTDGQFDELVQHLAFDKMRANASVNYEEVVKEAEAFYGKAHSGEEFKFYRRGQMNSHVDEMPAEFQQKFDEWTEARLSGTGFKFSL